jgi:hypothetical protein
LKVKGQPERKDPLKRQYDVRTHIETIKQSSRLIPWLLRNSSFANSSDEVIDFLSATANEKLEVFNLDLCNIVVCLPQCSEKFQGAYLLAVKYLFLEESPGIFINYSLGIFTVRRTPIIIMNDGDLDGAGLLPDAKNIATIVMAKRETN